jgi:hypothetical protein
VRRSQLLRVERWSAVVVLGLCIALGGCQRTRNERTLALSERSIAVLERDLASARQARQRVQEGWVLYTLGVVSQEQGQRTEARTRYEHALAIAREVKAPTLEAVTLSDWCRPVRPPPAWRVYCSCWLLGCRS